MPSGGWKSGSARLLALSVLLLTAGVSGCGTVTDAHAAVRVTPAMTLLDQPVSIDVTGLAKGQLVDLSVTTKDANGEAWDSHAEFRASDDGTVAVADSPALSGSYRGVQAGGLISDMQPVSAHEDVSFSWALARPLQFDLTVRAGSKIVARTNFERRGAAPGVTISNERVPATGFYGEMYRPAGPASSGHAAVLEFGGSEGGLSGEAVGAALASAGYPTLDLAYFQEPGLPQTLSDIPLSYFARALRWLGRQPGVDPKRVWVMGSSRGGEPALLLGADYPSLVYGVVANTPADIAECSFPGCNGPAWIYQGKPLPYYPEDPLSDDFLPVDLIQGPVLIDCGTDDQVWGRVDGCVMAGYDYTQLPANSAAHVLYRFVGGGHWVNNMLPYQPVSARYVLAERAGGVNSAANGKASVILWPRLLAFLADPARSGTYSVNVG